MGPAVVCQVGRARHCQCSHLLPTKRAHDGSRHPARILVPPLHPPSLGGPYYLITVLGHCPVTPRRQCNPGATVLWLRMPQFMPYPPVGVLVEVEVVSVLGVEAVGDPVGEIIGPLVVFSFDM